MANEIGTALFCKNVKTSSLLVTQYGKLIYTDKGQQKE